jgi:hypothetical protein
VFPDAQYRAPQLIEVLVIPSQDARITQRRIDQCEQSGVVSDVVGLRVGDRANDLVVQPRWRAQPLGPVVAPEHLCRART